MKKLYLLAGMAAMMLASCSTDEQSGGGYVPGEKVTLNASLPNSGTRVSEASSDTYGLVTNWSYDDSLDVLVNANTLVSMLNISNNTFTAMPANATIAAGFNAGQTIYGVNNKSNDNITTAVNGNQLKATLDFTGQDGTVENLAKYDLMYGKGDPTTNITFNHKICVLRLDLSSDSLMADKMTSLTGLKLKYVPWSGSQLFASKEVYNFGTTCDSTITSVDSIYFNKTNVTVSNGKATVYIAVPSRQNLYGTLYIHLKASNGTTCKAYDLANPIAFGNVRMRISTVHPQAITNLTGTTVKVGDYLFHDGSWGSLADSFGATPIAVIFSKNTSTADKGYKWTHGYAMAMKELNLAAWIGPTTISENPTGTSISTSAALILDKDGYTHTTSINSDAYPAAYAAATTYNTTIAAPGNTSGWYLPSIGQWYDICVNLGKMIPLGYKDQTKFLYWEGAASACANNLNVYLTPLTNGIYDAFQISDLYWSSSESGSDKYGAYAAYFNSYTGNMYLETNSKGSMTNVRSVIAF